MKEFLASSFGRKMIVFVLAGLAFGAAAFVADDAQAQTGLVGLGTTLGALALNLGGKTKDDAPPEDPPAPTVLH